MKKSMLVVLVVLLPTLFSLPGNVQAGPNDLRTYILTNELGSQNEGGLIDRLIAAGHGNKSLYQILLLLAAQPGNNIPADFVTEVNTNNPPGSLVFVDTLQNFAGINSPVGINADGTIIVAQIYGRDYDGHTGFATNNVQCSGIGPAKLTMATTLIYSIEAGSLVNISTSRTTYYKAFAIGWAGGIRLYLPLIIR